VRNLFNFVRQNFVSGLAVFVPFVITSYLLIEVGKWLNSLVILTPARFIQLPDVISPFFTEIILFLVAAFSFILLITLLGLGTKNLLGKLLVKFGEKTISKIPLANAIFTTTKEISKIIFSEGEKQKNVVLVEYPRKGAYCLGFATHPVDSGELEKIPIFIPTSPNPSSGFLVFFTKDEIQQLDISADEAFQLILSGGLAFNDPSSLSKFKF
jgi:uncharacterized membrane protein|tara:strand:+ start:3095 stop:3730 length:636 start_codon:yes stop_codon:yes gene_type:complete